MLPGKIVLYGLLNSVALVVGCKPFFSSSPHPYYSSITFSRPGFSFVSLVTWWETFSCWRPRTVWQEKGKVTQINIRGSPALPRGKFCKKVHFFHHFPFRQFLLTFCSFFQNTRKHDACFPLSTETDVERFLVTTLNFCQEYIFYYVDKQLFPNLCKKWVVNF